MYIKNTCFNYFILTMCIDFRPEFDNQEKKINKKAILSKAITSRSECSKFASFAITSRSLTSSRDRLFARFEKVRLTSGRLANLTFSNCAGLSGMQPWRAALCVGRETVITSRRKMLGENDI